MGVFRRGLLRVRKDAASDFSRLQREFQVLFGEAMAERARRSYGQALGDQGPWTLDAPNFDIEPQLNNRDSNELIDSYVRNRLRFYKGFSKDIAEDIKTAINQSVAAGQSPADLKRVLAESFQQVSVRRALLVARQEASIAYSQSRHDFWDKVLPGEIKTKEWLPTLGGKYDRQHHNRIPDLGPVKFDESFRIITPNGSVVHLRYPNDPLGPPTETMLCGCDYAINPA